MKRNITLDYFRIVLSILVIYFHLFVPLITSKSGIHSASNDWNFFITWEIAAFAKIVIPMFCMISGYYMDFSNGSKVYKYISKIFKLYVLWSLFYLPWYSENGLSSILWVLAVGYYHLWYLVALMMGILILYFFKRWFLSDDKDILPIVIYLYIVGYLIQLYLDGEGVAYKVAIYRNAFFYVIPFLFLGHMIKTTDICKYKIKKAYVIAGILLMLLESYIYMEIEMDNDIYLSGFLLAFITFIYVLQNGKMEDKANRTVINLSSAIYYIHLFMLVVCRGLIPETQNFWVQFPFTVIMTLFAAMVIVQANKIINIFL